jgi:predicted HicB family RNase H-like nuclease
MKYKGYLGVVELDEESGILFGEVTGLRDVITFQGETVAETIQAFHDSVDDYLEFCKARGENPEKPYSGQFVLRVDKALHRKLADAAQEQMKSLNALVEDTLAGAFPSDAASAKTAAGSVLPPARRHGTSKADEAGHVSVKPAGKDSSGGKAGYAGKDSSGGKARYAGKDSSKKGDASQAGYSVKGPAGKVSSKKR